MKTFKKKDIKKVNVDELVDPDGTFIGGDKTYNTTSQSRTAPQQTTDKYAKTAKQKMPWLYGYMGSPYSHGQRGSIGEEDTVDEAEKKMTKMVEDILTKKTPKKDMVNRKSNNDINRNNIPDLEYLAEKLNKQDIVSNVQSLMAAINSNKLSSEEKAIVINYIIQNIGTNDIEYDYKKILKGAI